MLPQNVRHDVPSRRNLNAIYATSKFAVAAVTNNAGKRDCIYNSQVGSNNQCVEYKCAFYKSDLSSSTTTTVSSSSSPVTTLGPLLLSPAREALRSASAALAASSRFFSSSCSIVLIAFLEI